NVRLADGGKNWGRVEVFHNGEWGTVCDNNMDDNFVDVLCAQLGMNNGTILQNFNYKKGTGKIWMDNVKCTGAELSIENCTHRGWGIHYCNHEHDDVGVVCDPKNCDASPTIINGKVMVESYSKSYGYTARVICDPGYRVYQNLTRGRVKCMPHGEWETVLCERNVALEQTMNNSGNVRLADGGKNWGRVEVFHNGEWGTVCDDHMDDNFVDVLCAQLGMNNGNILQNLNYKKGTGKIWMDNVECTGAELSIENCTHHGWGIHDCNHEQEDVGVVCDPKNCTIWPTIIHGDIMKTGSRTTYSRARVICDSGYRVYQNLTDGGVRCMPHGEWETVLCEKNGVLAESSISGNVRLADGAGNWGRVEVFHDGEWGTVCDNDMDNNFVDVLCSQLGMNKGQFLRNFEFKKGSEKVWFEEVKCSGAELSIENCTLTDWGETNYFCYHERDVGVVCNPKDCVSPQVIDNGTIVKKGSTSYGSIARVICNPGFRVFGNLTNGGVKCLPHGEWESVQCENNNVTVESRYKGNVRLADGGDTWGRVEVFHDGEWGAVCQNINNNFAEVLCAQLGMNAGEILLRIDFKKGRGRIWLSNVYCYGTELSITDCAHDGWGNHSCGHYSEVGVACNPKDCDATPKIAYGYINKHASTLVCNTCDPGYRIYQYSSGDVRCLLNSELNVINTLNKRVRLADGGLNWGRVEVFHDGEWGTVCDYGADTTFANVLCQELGMGNGTISKLSEFQIKTFFEADSRIWLDEVKCTGNESSIVDCAHTEWGAHNCGHSEDIVVLCYANDCGVQVQKGDKKAVASSTLYGSFSKFTCNPGYRTSQNLTTGNMACMPDGKWEAIQCEKTDDHKTDNREDSPAPVKCLPNTDFNGVEWDAVDAGKVTRKNCTDGYTGMITRTCNTSGYYENPTNNCTKQAIHALLNKIKDNVSADVKETIDDLRKEISLENNTTSEKTTLHVGDIETATEIMKLITDRFEAHNSSIENVTDSFVDVVDNLISDRTTHSWGALLDKGGAATVINVLDEFISKVVNNSAVSKQNMTVRKDNIFIEIGSVAQCSKIKFPNSGKNGNVPDWAMTRHDTVEVACRGSGGLTFSGSLFRNMTSIMSSKTKNSRHMEINTPVLAFSVHDSITASDAQNVTLIFELFNTDLAKPSCRFWEKGNSSGEGFWSSDGCKLVEYNHQAGRVTCSCNHLTNFAVLMSPGVTVEKIHHQALSAITVIGCCLSLAGLVTTSVIYVYCWRMVKSNRATLLLNLCAALFVAYIAFLIGIKRTQPMGACTFTAVLLHYVYLVAFFLMLAEGGVIALMVLSPLTKRNSVPYFLAGAYGIPVVIVGVSMVATQLDGYGNDRFCWLSVESGLFWAFAGPVLAIVVTNLIILVLVLKQLFGVAAMSKKTDAEKVKTGVRSVCILLPVLGLTWVFGIFAVNKDTLVFQYLFAIFNSLQGFLIFLVQCVFDRKVRDALRQRKLPWFTSTDVRTGDTEMRSTQKST
ncbi:hypothetical protein DPMN_052971, partial [Dreissena polymorpha]